MRWKFAALAVITLLLGMQYASMAADVTFEISDATNGVYVTGPTTETGDKVLADVIGNATGMANPAGSINKFISDSYRDERDQYTAEVEISITGGQSYTPGGAPSLAAVWNLHGSDSASATGAANGTTIGYKSVVIKGETGQRTVLTADGTGNQPLMRIQNVKDTVSLSNLTFQGGSKTESNGGSYSGGGLLIDRFTSGTATAVNLTEVTFNQNSVTHTLKGGGSFGAGLAISGSGVEVANFKDVNITGNKASVIPTVVAADTHSAQGAGAYLVGLNGLTYDGGTISGNEAEITAGSHSHGGGLTYMASTTGQVTLKNYLTFSENKAIINENGSGPGQSFARGGGLLVYGYADNAYTTLIVDNGVVFERNEAIATATAANDAVIAMGGAVHLRHNVDATFKDARFSENKATSLNGKAWGGAVSTDYDTQTPYDPPAEPENYHNTKLTFNDVTFDQNAASGRTEGWGGAIYMHEGDLTVGDSSAYYNYFTNNTATASDGAGAGGAIYFNNAATRSVGTDTSALSVTDSVFGDYDDASLGNTASGDIAMGGAIYSKGLTNTIRNSDFYHNQAIADGVGATASGGAAHFASGAVDIEDTYFIGNKAANSAANGVALGGAIFGGVGTVNLTDTDVHNNSVAGQRARGAGIFMETNDASATAGVTTTLNLKSTYWQMGVVANLGNSSSGDGAAVTDIYFGSSDGSTTTTHDAELNMQADAGSELYVGSIGVDMYGAYGYTENIGSIGYGFVSLSGASRYNVEGLTQINFAAGSTTELEDDYSKSFTGSGDAEVNLGNNSTLIMALPRADGYENIALFDFENGGARDFNVGDGVTLVGSVAALSAGYRPVYSYTADYVLVDGLGLTTAEAKAQILDKIALEAADDYVVMNNLSYNVATGAVSANASYYSPFVNNGKNTYNATPALDQLLNDTELVWNDEWDAMRNNPRALTAELYMNQGHVMLDGSDRAALDALDHGLRNFHHSAIRLGSGGYSSVSALGQIADGGGYRPRRQIDCTPRYSRFSTPAAIGGLRLWAGYFGDFRRNRASDGNNGYNVDRNGFLIGVNYDFGMMASVGIYGGYSHAKSEDRAVHAKIKQDTGHFGLQGRVSPLASMPNLSFYGDVGYHFSDNDSDRSYNGNLGTYDASGSFDQRVFAMSLSAEYMFCFGNFNLTPYARFRYAHLNQDSLNEAGSAATTTRTSGFNKSAFNHRLGVEASYDFLAGGGVFTPAIDLTWVHNWNSRTFDSTSFYNKVPGAIPGVPVQHFRTSSTKASRDSLDLGIGVRTAFNIGARSQLGGEAKVNLSWGNKSFTTSLYAGAFLAF